MTPLRLDLIVRTSKRKREARSPKQQRDIAEQCAKLNGYRIVAVHDSGGSESGKTMDRASIRAAMGRVRSGEVDGVIVALLDRIGRAPIEEAMTWVRELDRVGVLVVADAGGQPVNLAEPSAETNLVLQLQIARQQWLATASRAERTKRDAIAAGKFVGPTPFGYLRRGGRLFEHDKWGPVVREAFQLAARHGHHAAIEHLRQVAPRVRKWNTDSVRRLLGSRVYLGESRSGDLPPNLNAHGALTTPADWNAAQAAPRMRRSNGDYLLSHVASCGRCGSGLVGALQSVRGARYRRYRCSNPDCRGGSSISADSSNRGPGLEEHVRAAVRARLGDERYRLSIEPVGRDDAERDLKRAQWDFEQFQQATAGMPAAAIRSGLEVRQAAVDQAAERFRRVAEQSARHEVLPLAGELDDDGKLLAAIRAGVVSIVVRPGRGTVAERVAVVFVGDEFDDRAGVLAA